MCPAYLGCLWGLQKFSIQKELSHSTRGSISFTTTGAVLSLHLQNDYA
jgi:hypothetical protein